MDHEIFIVPDLEDYLDTLISAAEEVNQKTYAVEKDLAKTTEGELVIRYQFSNEVYEAIRSVIVKRDGLE